MNCTSMWCKQTVNYLYIRTLRRLHFRQSWSAGLCHKDKLVRWTWFQHGMSTKQYLLIWQSGSGSDCSKAGGLCTTRTLRVYLKNIWCCAKLQPKEIVRCWNEVRNNGFRCQSCYQTIGGSLSVEKHTYSATNNGLFVRTQATRYRGIQIKQSSTNVNRQVS